MKILTPGPRQGINIEGHRLSEGLTLIDARCAWAHVAHARRAKNTPLDDRFADLAAEKAFKIGRLILENQ